MRIEEDTLWYKDAIIYQLHVRTYCDSNGDGIGDFAGLTSKLDYLKGLGVNTLWLLPFYPSPLRDDGYDIADYSSIHSDYGTIADFRLFLKEAHKRDLRVITELVINHTSDQHPWFQAARVAPADSIKRNYYVWSDTAKKYEGTRIIFTDTEKSNWTWDETAKAYYWHRFFSHQPDLNFANPHVIKAVLRAMRFWFDMGVDGMRLDAIPYLCEREGTSNENLPETHAVIKYLRTELDRHYANRVFLAEANQWPEDVYEYFGDGDECHMAFHFPLMPRIFMAVAQEDRHPIIEILAQTPEIPENCQWAIFLRNHDELTLEMVTDRERDYMYLTYATDPRARLNLGIRRRLAPLMEGNRSKIELMTSLLLSMPGSPIIYYGDEIGMGDNIYLGDRHGVRTPMQWSPDRNAGFSHADPQRLYLPPLMDPLYGYEAVNVEAQSRNANSLLNWMKRLILTRKIHKAFGRGTIKFLHPGNRKILAYLREYQDENILCVANLANTVLRNHDELTLEMVTDRERDYMYLTYATDPRARLNLGIRRRLAPLMEGNRSKIELMTSLLLSMPGSPIIYYGDEIGMGDNIYLGDRHGVRTPMQWSPDRNAGFSHADPQRLYLPPLMDPLYGYEAVNVEAQSRNANSLLNWMKRLILTRKIHKAFGRGTIKFLHPGNRKILAYLREYQDENILCVANLANTAQPVELDLAAYKGCVPVELLGRTAFPAIGELPYLLSLPSYSFYWFRLATDVDAPVWHVDKLPREELPVLVLPEGLLSTLMSKPKGKVSDVLARKTRAKLETEVLPLFLSVQHWVSKGGKTIVRLELELADIWKTAESKEWLPLLVNVTFDSGIVQTYFLPLGLLLGEAADQQYHALSPWMLAKVRQHARVGVLYDALGEDAFCHFLLNAIVTEARLPFASGEMIFSRTSALPELPEALTVIRPGVEQSNTSIVYGDQAILKVYRRVQSGINPELEMGRFLTEISPCSSITPLIGSLEYHTHDSVTGIAALHQYVSNQGSFGDYTQDYLNRYFKLCIDEPGQAYDPKAHMDYQAQMNTLGQRTAELHQALSQMTGNSAFDPERQPLSEITAHVEQLRARLIAIFDKLEQILLHLPGPLHDMCNHLLSMRLRMLNRVNYSLPDDPVLYKIRIHGNYHLGQILIVHNNFIITDFEGDPYQPLEMRRAKQSPLRDIAGLYHSLCTCMASVLYHYLAECPDHRDRLESCAQYWISTVIDAFRSGYRMAIAGCCAYPLEPMQEQRLLELFLLEKMLNQLDIALTEQPASLESAVRVMLNLIVDNKLLPVSSSVQINEDKA